MKRVLAVLALSLACQGCGFVNVNTFGEKKLKEKSITVQPGSAAGTLGGIKSVLYRCGWKIKVLDEGTTETRQMGDRTVSIRTYSTTYRLLTSSYYLPQTGFAFDLSLIENETGEEVLTLGGVKSPAAFVDRFSYELNAWEHGEPIGKNQYRPRRKGKRDPDNPCS